MESVTLKVDQAMLERIKSFYEDDLIENNGEYVYFCANHENVIITGYKSNKATKTVTFIGKGALYEANIFDISAIVNNENKKEDLHFIDFQDQIGSDEVGVGDFLLPVVVSATYVKESQMKRLKELGIADSKKLSDERIRELGPIVSKEFKFSNMIVPNDKYNEVVEKGNNLNAIKAKLHNACLLKLHKEYPDVIAIYVDQFVSPTTYYSYLKDEKEIVKDISFKCKGESLFPCVALASVIARYTFLLYKDKLEEKYGMTFPFGSSSKVDKFSQDFIKKYGREEFDHIAKHHFKNYENIK